MTQKKIEKLNHNPEQIWGAATYKGLVWLYKAYAGIKFSCEVIEYVNGGDTYKFIGDRL